MTKTAVATGDASPDPDLCRPCARGQHRSKTRGLMSCACKEPSCRCAGHSQPEAGA